MTAKPCTSASLIIRTGKPPSRAANASANAMSCHPSTPKCGAVRMRVVAHDAGESRSRSVAGGSSATSGSTRVTSTSTSCSGVQGCGVATRSRSVFICPCASMIAALSPVPPTSTARMWSALLFLPLTVLFVVTLKPSSSEWVVNARPHQCFADVSVSGCHACPSRASSASLSAGPALPAG